MRGQDYPVSLCVVIWSPSVVGSQSVSDTILNYYTQSLFIDFIVAWAGSCPNSSGEGRRKAHMKVSLSGHCAPDFDTCPSSGTSAFCVSLLGSDSLAGITLTVLAFFSSSAKVIRRNAGFSHHHHNRASPSL